MKTVMDCFCTLKDLITIKKRIVTKFCILHTYKNIDTKHVQIIIYCKTFILFQNARF